MKPILKIMIGVIVLATCSITPAFSQENVDGAGGDRDLSVGLGFPDSSQKLQGHIGLGSGFVPEYEGSGDYAVTALPLVEIGRAGAFFVKGANINPNDGLASAGVTLLHFTYSEKSSREVQLLLGPLVRFHGGRDEDDSDVLEGLGDIDPSVGLGGFMEFSAGSWRANATLSSQDAGDGKDGLLITLDARHSIMVSDKLTVSPGLSISWADDDYMQGFFGVTDPQASRSGLRRFDSEAGFKDVGMQLHASYAVTERVTLESQVGYWHLLNDAADSPIVDDKGSVGQFRTLVGLAYRF